MVNRCRTCSHRTYPASPIPSPSGIHYVAPNGGDDSEAEDGNGVVCYVCDARLTPMEIEMPNRWELAPVCWARLWILGTFVILNSHTWASLTLPWNTKLFFIFIHGYQIPTVFPTVPAKVTLSYQWYVKINSNHMPIVFCFYSKVMLFYRWQMKLNIIIHSTSNMVPFNILLSYK